MLNLSQGFPDYPCSRVAAHAARDALKLGHNDQYSPIPGTPRITKAISALYGRMYPKAKAFAGSESLALDPSDEVCAVTSGTEALFCTVMGLVDPGDEVVFFEPFFPWYLPCIRMAGGVPKPVRLEGPSFDLLTVERQLRSAFSSKVKLCIFNTPHNPTGHCATSAEVELLASLCRERDVLCVSDEVYEGCMFDGTVHNRICELEGMWARTATIGSASKLFALTGWRIGWVTGPAELVKAARTMHAYTTFCAPSPLQEGVAAALEAEVPILRFDDQGKLMHRNWQELAGALRSTGVEVCPASGGYFLVADVSSTGMSDIDYCRWLASERRIAAVPMSLFYSPPGDSALAAPSRYVRFAVCKEPGTIDKAVAALMR